ncbi:MAG: tRNA (adenosine(37)-N6)-threonylcarbamoyltransferase complex transferase subunit TsaD [Desulfuromonas sp.]|uniref:tRNA (adenosine(37)-N6)-threonylcarbamoyltransferase complex transferase subunit TsaD n=1 Tax=Desulfuromonas sp. TaxID=892 RepID=UPI000CB437E0|nr:tRNA (adenosine(37)-N6)-threonylcarbamoyltransferase complex transferase subunit TsaD [Desulfuromonas sp.]PLX85186.1 MAG: tRNA (adenosine(37)-N6)-threonylcarbamoyltransferase complex transferase subunit TsaD [Desulfuromonas sp.]
MLLLCIESSCDETAAAVVRDGRQILSSIVASQVDVHARYGGVVPELASRKHVEAISVVVEEALEKAGTDLDAIEGIAVTRGPGLVGALLVGLSAAKAIAFARDLPLVGLHHMEGHILAVNLEEEVPFPYLALAVSGGHTHLYRVEGIGRYRTLGRTLDDAAGEAFDKVAKLLGLSYPGGILIDRLAAEGDAGAVAFPRPLLHKDNLDFSFSGIKTSVLNWVRKQKEPVEGQLLRDVAASFQEAVVDVLSQKTLRAARQEGLERIVVAGGVACNSGLRTRLRSLGEKEGLAVHFPSPALCGDNAAMLGVGGDFYLSRGVRGDLKLNALSSWVLDEVVDESGAR